jgi:flagellar biogenesis protein FliO
VSTTTGKIGGAIALVFALLWGAKRFGIGRRASHR